MTSSEGNQRAKAGLRIVRALIAIAVACGLFFVVARAYCWRNGIHNVRDLENFRMMRSWEHPILHALQEHSIVVGTSLDVVRDIESPQWTEDFGRCQIFHYTPEGSYDRLVVVSVDNHVVSASAGSCTWHWTFFDNVPEDVRSAVGKVQGLRQTIELSPQFENILRPQLEQQMAILQMAP